MQEFKFTPYFSRGYLYYRIHIKRWWGWKSVTHIQDYELEGLKQKLKNFKVYEEKL